MPLQSPPDTRKVVVVHGGARDGYQVAQALAEADLLQALITDLFWPEDRAWARLMADCLPRDAQALLRARSSPGVPVSKVRTSVIAGLKALSLDRMKRLPFSLRRKAIRSADASLGQRA
ncbi:MAG: hypothetical protein INR62_10720, partial [Rhodospirillales bacterium]|nr:hypothetical protein [Acetobacter sp.]